ncbi:MAG: asparagine synthase C-terminal domain-containing protein, partial [Fimbriimonadaceae bacterium]|nr:asparagine synthase C-terminal domain-containing protein [Alphaproteobacteria bacterium]
TRLVRTTMRQSVERALRADVPVGLYLSGGVDSSILAVLIQQIRGEEFNTFSVNFEDEQLDESGFQDVMVRKVGARHTRLRLSAGDVGKSFASAVYHAEAPLFRAAPTPLFLLSEAVHSAGFKVVLSGEGADEVFWGYDTFRESFVRLLWSKVPESKWRPRLLQKIFPYLEQYSNARNFEFLKDFYRHSLSQIDDPFYSMLPRWQNNLALLSLFDPDFLGDSQSSDMQRRQLAAALGPKFGDEDVYQRHQSAEMLTLLAGYLLSSQGDRMLMSHSVEGRFPFLDNEVVDLTAAIPGRLKCKGMKDKYILREAFREDLPQEIFSRPKFAYRSPDLLSFFCGGKALPYVEELMSPEYAKRVGVFHPDRIAGLFQKGRSSERRTTTKDNMAFVFVLSTHLLHQHFVENRGRL